MATTDNKKAKSEEQIDKEYQEFLDSLEVIFGHEGGLSNHKRDKGLITKYGISLKFLQAEGIDIDGDGDVDKDDILVLTKEKAEQLYYKYFYLRVKADQIKNRKLATLLFDMAVNHGTGTAVILLQKAERNIINRATAIDGVIGNQTVTQANEYGDQKKLYFEVLSRRKEKYYSIIENDPTQAVFKNGWMNRVEFFKNYFQE